MLTISLYVTTNTGIGASAFVKLLIGKSKVVALPRLFHFKLMNTITVMCTAGAYFLAFLVLIMSCLWPFVRLFIMLYIWLVPLTSYPLKKREKMLRFLDAFGKWSFVDLFTMILFIVTFNLNLPFPIVSPQVESPVVLNIWVVPTYNLALFIIGNIVSLILSHVILAIHRYIENKLEPDSNQNTSTPTNYENSVSNASSPSLFVLSNAQTSNGQKRKALFRYSKYKSLGFLIIFILLSTLALFVSGVSLESFSFDFVGLAGFALNLLDYQHKKDYGVIDLATKITKAVEYPKSFTVILTQVVYIAIVFIIPCIHIIGLIIVWLIPLTIEIQKKLYHICETLYAWSCLDVFAVSIVVGVLQISQVAHFMIDTKCALIDPLVQMFFAEEELVKGHESCYDVISKLLDGSWLILTAAILLNIATVFVNFAAKRAFEPKKSNSQIYEQIQDSTKNLE